MILIIAASSGKNLELGHRFEGLAKELGLDASLIDLTDHDLPLYTPREEERGRPSGLAGLAERFLEARACLVCAPEYNGSIPPCLPSAIAWLSTGCDDFRQVFNGKPVGLATHSGGAGQKCLVAMRLQFGHLGSNVIGRECLTNKDKPLNEATARSILRQLAAYL